MRGFAAASQGRALRARRVGAGGGRGVTVYALDSGVRATHQEFVPWGGGASRAAYGCARVAGAAGGPPPCLRRSFARQRRALSPGCWTEGSIPLCGASRVISISARPEQY